MKHKRNMSLLLTLTIMLATILPAVWPYAIQAQDCVNPALNTPSSAWPSNAVVYVYVGDIPMEYHSCIFNVLINWESSGFPQQTGSDSNNFGVSFYVRYESSSMDVDASGQVINGVPYSIAIKRRIPFTGGAGETGGQSLDGWRYNAVINMHPGITNFEAFSQTFAREMGHTYGLGECPECMAPRQSVMMTKKVSLNDTSQGLKGPTPCDSRKLRRTRETPINIRFPGIKKWPGAESHVLLPRFKIFPDPSNFFRN
jgi:hypothetical protein